MVENIAVRNGAPDAEWQFAALSYLVCHLPLFCIHFKNNCFRLSFVSFFLFGFVFVMSLPLAGETNGRSLSYI